MGIEIGPKIYPLAIVDILGIVTTSRIFFHPFKLIALTTNAQFTIDPTINCELVDDRANN